MLTSTATTSCALLRGIEMKGMRCVLLATSVTGQREGGNPPSPPAHVPTTLRADSTSFPHLCFEHVVEKENVFVCFEYSCFLHQGIITVS